VPPPVFNFAVFDVDVFTSELPTSRVYCLCILGLGDLRIAWTAAIRHEAAAYETRLRGLRLLHSRHQQTNVKRP